MISILEFFSPDEEFPLIWDSSKDNGVMPGRMSPFHFSFSEKSRRVEYITSELTMKEV